MADQEAMAFDEDLSRILGIDDDLNQVLAAEGRRLAKVRERHSRETVARRAEAVQVSRETLRQAVHVRRAEEADPSHMGGLNRAVSDGRLSVDQAYRIVRGDTRRALYVKLSPDVVDELEAECNRKGVTKAALIESLLRERYRI